MRERQGVVLAVVGTEGVKVGGIGSRFVEDGTEFVPGVTTFLDCGAGGRRRVTVVSRQVLALDPTHKTLLLEAEAVLIERFIELCFRCGVRVDYVMDGLYGIDGGFRFPCVVGYRDADENGNPFAGSADRRAAG